MCTLCADRGKTESACCQFEVYLCAVGGKTESQHAVSLKCVCVLSEGKQSLYAVSLKCLCAAKGRVSMSCCHLCFLPTLHWSTKPTKRISSPVALHQYCAVHHVLCRLAKHQDQHPRYYSTTHSPMSVHPRAG